MLGAIRHVDHLDVTVPAALVGRWDVEGSAVAQQTELERSQGDRVVRLKLATELTRSARLRFRYRIPSQPPLSPKRPADLKIPGPPRGGS